MGRQLIDLAHATVYTSTMWDADVAAALNDDEVAAFYAVYFDALPRTLDRIDLVPLRRLLASDDDVVRQMAGGVAKRAGMVGGAARSVYIASVRKRVNDY